MTPLKLANKKLSIHVASTLGDLTAVAGEVDIALANLESKAVAEGWTGAELASAQITQLNRVKTAMSGAFRSATSQSVTLGSMAEEAGEERGLEQVETMFMWQAISSNICKDCVALNGQVRTYLEWMEYGLPGSGHTVCGNNCKCQLVKVRDNDPKPPLRIVKGYVDKDGKVVESKKGPRGGKAKTIALKPSTKATPLLDLTKDKKLTN